MAYGGQHIYLICSGLVKSLSVPWQKAERGLAAGRTTQARPHLACFYLQRDNLIAYPTLPDKNNKDAGPPDKNLYLGGVGIAGGLSHYKAVML